MLARGGASKSLATKVMGQQHRKVIKRRRRKEYLKRKEANAKLGGLAKKSVAKKEAAPAKKAAKKTAKKAAKKTAKKAAKKAPAKKAPAKEAPEAAEEDKGATSEEE
ncbi:hypothetical protein HAHE_41570 [Haloferula helveola]|uniref:Uncharacterized protein n=2 Tax=Haloferula helveola TaxID=490095 RepID=A0ABM7RIA4_9BACT|nr:hypothetical protein HAHE_41570 [Haloferula helveola]